MDAAALSQRQLCENSRFSNKRIFKFICENNINIIMQRPGFNQGYPSPGMNNGMPMQPGMSGGPAGYHNPGGPVYAAGYGQPMPGQQPRPNFQPNAGCFMPAATIRKISNTTPPQRFDPSFN